MTAVQDARPPLAVVRTLNTAMRRVLRSPLGRVVRPLALLEFQTRRTGRRLRVPVGFYLGTTGRVVVTPAPWRANFADGIDATVYFHGGRQRMHGTLDNDGERVSAELQSMLDGGMKPAALGLKVQDGHRLSAEDVRQVNRQLIRFTPLDDA